VNKRWYKGILCGLLLLLPGLAAAQSDETQVVIVKGSDNAYYNQSVEALISHVDRAARFSVVMASELATLAGDAAGDKLFVALGQSAVEAVNRLGGDIGSINAYLTHEQYDRLKLEHQMTVLLDQPLHRYLAFCRLMLPLESIGVIGEQQIDLEPNHRLLLRDLAFELNQYQVDAQNRLLPVLRDLLQQNDALLMLPRQALYNRDTLKGVLLTSYRNRKPVISYSPAHVKSGALASIYSSPTDIGRHLALLLNHRLKSGGQAQTGYEYARFYSISTNRKVARALGIDLPEETGLRRRLDRFGP
jgi:hypothetical protein